MTIEQGDAMNPNLHVDFWPCRFCGSGDLQIQLRERFITCCQCGASAPQSLWNSGSTVLGGKTVGEAIRNLRKEKGFRQKEFSVILGISTRYLSDIERGNKEINVKLIKSIAEKFPEVNVPMLVFRLLKGGAS